MKKIMIISSLPIQYIIFNWLKGNQNWVENFYIITIFKNISSTLRIITGWIGFSFGLLAVYFFFIFILFSIIRLIFFRKKPAKTYFLSLITTISISYGIYMLLWGLAYHRKPIAEIRNLNIENINDKEIEKLCENLIVKSNNGRDLILKDDVQNIYFKKYFKLAGLGYQSISNENKEFRYKYPSIKPAMGNTVLSWLNTAGIYTFWSGEANVNVNLANFEAPFVICHEMAHQIGFASEEEANYVSYLACTKNSNKIFQYSANNQALLYALRAVYENDSLKYQSFLKMVNPAVKADWEYAKKIRKQFESPIINKISSFVYDLFLKSNSQKSGIKSYGLVVELLVGEMRMNGLRK